MKYFNINTINKAISLIREGQDTKEHVTSRAVSGMLSNYYKPSDNFIVTPEQTQFGSGKRPDYSIEKFSLGISDFVPHCFVEVKSLVNSNIGNILDQLYDTVLFTLDHKGYYSVFMIAVKGTKIAFYTYHNFSSLLDEYSVPHYKGFIPLNYLIPWAIYSKINKCTLQDYDKYVRLHNFHTDATNLKDLGAISNDNINHPHILDLLDKKHEEDIHKMYIHIFENIPDIFRD